ncbi:hypothetical protein [Streptomyces sp. NPDC003006]
MPSALLTLVTDTVKACDTCWSLLLEQSTQDIKVETLEVVLNALAMYQKGARKATVQDDAAQDAIQQFLTAVKQALERVRVLKELVQRRDQFLRRRSVSAAAKDIEAMEEKVAKLTDALETVLDRGDPLKQILMQHEAQVHRLRGVRVVIDDEVG